MYIYITHSVLERSKDLCPNFHLGCTIIRKDPHMSLDFGGCIATHSGVTKGTICNFSV